MKLTSFSHLQNAVLGWGEFLGPSSFKVNHLHEASICTPPEQSLPTRFKLLRQNDQCSPKCMQLPPFLEATIASCLFPVENGQKLRADELRREYYEEQRNEFENFVQEQNDGKSSSATLLGEVGLWGKIKSCFHISLDFN